MPFRCHTLHLPAPCRRQRPRLWPLGSARAQFGAWSETSLSEELPTFFSAADPWPTPPASTAASQSARCHTRLPTTDSPPPDNCPVCPVARNIAVLLLPSARLSLENRYHPRSNKTCSCP